jgi:hypothetical protein
MKNVKTDRRILLAICLAVGLGSAAPTFASIREESTESREEGLARDTALEEAASIETRLPFPNCRFRFECDASDAALACGTDKVQTLIDCIPSVVGGPTTYIGCVVVAVAPSIAQCIAERCVKFSCR